MRSTRRPRDAARRELRAALQRATDAVHTAVAAACARGVATPEDVQQLRSILKEGARAQVGSDQALRVVTARMDAMRAEFLARVTRVTSGEADGSGGGATAGGRATEDASSADPPPGVPDTAVVAPDNVRVVADQTRRPALARRTEGGGGESGEAANIPALTGPVSDGPVRRRRPAGVNLTPLGVARAPGPLTLAEFDDALLADQARTAAVVRLMALGRSARRALRELGMPCTGAEVRWAQRSFARAQQGGGLHDRRRDRRGERAGARTVMTAAMEVLVLNHWSSRPTISAATVRQLVVETVVGLAAAAATRGEPFAMRVPSRKTIVAFVGALPPAVRLARARGVERWLKEGAPKALYEPARAGNEYHQIDHTPLDVVVRVLVAATWIPVRPFLTLILDVYSRAVMGFTVSLQGPDAFTTAHALRSAILPKAARDDVFGTGALRGLPLFVTPDHGKDFESHAVAISMRALGIGLEFCPPHYPDMKAEIERLFRSINEGFCARWPGYTKADGSSAGAVAKRIDQLLTMRQLIRELARWIDEYNTTVPDGATESPLDRWLRSARIVEPRPRDLDVLLLKADATRVVTNRGIRFTPPGAPRGTYWAPELPAHWRREVTIRYNPDDLESVLVFDAATGRFVCEAWLTDVPGARYDHADIKRVRLELYRRLVGLRTEGRRALKERMAEYWAEAEAEGRDARRRSGAEWAEMRQIADEVAAAAPSGPDGASGARRRPAAGTRGGEVDASVDALVDALQQPLRLLPPPAPAAPVDDIDALLEELSRPAPVGDVAARDAGDRRIAPTRGTGPAPEEEPGP